MEKILLSLFEVANKFYVHSFSLYKPFYFLYKKVSDRKVIAWLSERVRPGMTVVDIGGNIGFYSILFSHLVGKHGRVHVFEPDPVNFKHLKALTSKLENVVVNPHAVAERSGTIRLYRSDELNVDHQTYDNGENRKSIEVPCITLDEYFHDGERVDFIKIDIQGYEYNALLGMKATIKRSSSVAIFSEFWPYGLQKAGTVPDESLALLKGMGFELKFWGHPEGIDYHHKLDDKNFYTNIYGIKK